MWYLKQQLTLDSTKDGTLVSVGGGRNGNGHSGEGEEGDLEEGRHFGKSDLG